MLESLGSIVNTEKNKGEKKIHSILYLHLHYIQSKPSF